MPTILLSIFRGITPHIAKLTLALSLIWLALKTLPWTRALAAIALVLGGLGLWHGWDTLQEARKGAQEASQRADLAQGSLEALKARTEALVASHEKERQALQDRAKAAQAEKEAYAKQNQDLKKALEDNPDWANTPVPDGVRRALGAQN